MDNRILVTYYNRNNDPTCNTVATFGLKVISMDLYLGTAKLIRKKDGTYFIAPGSDEYTCPQTGQKKYKNEWWFGPKTIDFFQRESVKAVKTFCQNKNLPDPFQN